jgi:regulator of protease activity HflC (stomatin/prohibitin superfamily)
MRKVLMLALFAIVAMSGVACSKVTAGHVGVKVNLLGGEKGVEQEVLGVGRYWIGMNEELYLFPTFQQNYSWVKTEGEDESITFQTKEGMAVNADFGISYSLNPDKIATIFQKYRRGVNELTDTVLRNAVRDAINAEAAKLSVEETYSTKKMELLMAVKNQVKTEFDALGIMVEDIYLIGSMRLPSNVIAALNSKIEATQRAQQRENELRESEAEAKKKFAIAEGESKAMLIKARAEADSNKLKLQTLTRELIEYEAVQRWNGQLPQVSGSGATPFINLNLGK